MDLSSFKIKFIEEASILLINLEKDLLTLEKEPENMKIIEDVFRVMHTLKGVSSMYGYDNIGDLTHKLENIYELIREGNFIITAQIIDTTLFTCDHIKRLLEDETFSNPKNIKNHEKVENKIKEILAKAGIKEKKRLKKKKQVEGQTSTYNIIFYPDESIITRNINLIAQFKELFSLGTYQIVHSQFTKAYDHWSIFLVTEKTLEDIEDALFFILDDCKINRIADFDVFNEEQLEENSQLFNNINTSNKNAENSSATEKSSDNELLVTTDIEIGKHKTSRIAVDSEKLDKLMFLVSELITTNSQLLLTTNSKTYDPIKEYLNKLNYLSNEFRSNAIEIRLVPVEDMALSFQRLIRDLSKHLDKKIEFVTQGTNTELDKNTIDLLAEPLMHIIRNCIDHGIQTPEVRIENGKEPTGIIKLVAFHSGNNIFIQIQDDGMGIDTDVIHKKAIEKGFLKEDEIVSQKQLFDLMFMPGFSTAQNLTEISGRGVGLDVVKQNITELRGEIEVNSEIGLGTSFTIKLQQSIAIMDTMLFSVGDMSFLVPMEDIELCTAYETEYIKERSLTNLIPYKEQLIPFVDLHKEFNLKNKYPKRLETIIISKNEKYFAIVAERIIGEHQAVLKNIAKEYEELDFLSGASVLADGKIAMLLDNAMLYTRVKNLVKN